MLRQFSGSKPAGVLLLLAAGAVGCSSGAGSGNSSTASTVAPATSASGATSPGATTTQAAPAIVVMTPTSGRAGDKISIVCKNLGSNVSVDFNGLTALVARTAQGSLVTLDAMVPAGVTTGPVHVTDAASGKVLDAGVFTVLAPPAPAPNPLPPTPTPSPSPSPAPSTPPTSAAPAVLSMTPTSGMVGDVVTIVCTNLLSVTTVDFNGVPAAAPVPRGLNGSVALLVIVPAGATTGDVHVTTSALAGGAPSYALTAGTFTVLAPPPPPATPAVVSVNPPSGAVGDSIAILCTNVGASVSVDFNNTAAVATINSSLAANGNVEIDAIVPAGATTGHIHIYDSGSQSTLDAGNFTVTPPKPANVTVVKATLEDTNSDHVVDQGDALTVTFSDVVAVTTSDPAGQIDLLVAGDTFGQGATLAQGSNPNEVVVTLGAQPHFRVTGTFSAQATGSYLASGLDVGPAATGIAPVTSGAALQTGAGVDVASTTFQEGVFAATASLVHSRGLHTATLLDDGRVLIVGGVSSTGPGNAHYELENEIFDPATNTFMLLSDPTLGGTDGLMTHTAASGKVFTIGRYAHTATKLQDGRVLIAGGHGYESRDTADVPTYSELASCFLFDPTTNTFTETGALATARRDHAAVLLGNGAVLVFGGRDANGTVASSEIYDPASGQWTAGPDMKVGRFDAAVVPYAGGIFVAGGATETGRGTANDVLALVKQDEAFDPTVPGFALASTLQDERRNATGTLLDTGDMVVAGGIDANGATTSIERYDQTLGGFVKAGSLLEARARHVASALEDGVLVVGGMVQDPTGAVKTIDTVETLDPAKGAVMSYNLGTPRLSATVTRLADGSYLILGGFQAPTKDVRGLDGQSNASAEVFVRP